MAISLYDQCTTTDWENIALRVSQVSAALALVISIVALSLGTLIEPSERTFLFLSTGLKSHQLHQLPLLLLPSSSFYFLFISSSLVFSPTSSSFFSLQLLSPSSFSLSRIFVLGFFLYPSCRLSAEHLGAPDNILLHTCRRSLLLQRIRSQSCGKRTNIVNTL
jgi:hypothetical protein